MFVTLRPTATLRAALFAVVSGLGLHYGFHFSALQSIGLSFIFFILILSIHLLELFSAFRPYAVKVYIRLPVLLTDLGLIQTPKDWKPYREIAQTKGVEYENFTIYALSPWLFAVNPHTSRPYTQKFEIRRQIEEISIPETPNSTSALIGVHRFLKIAFEERGKSFVLRIVVPDDWKQELRNRFPEADVEIKGWDYGDVTAVLASFPSRYLQHIIESHEPVSLIRSSLWRLRDKRFSKWLKENGWERADEFDDSIKHKYISVSFYPEF